ncbi:MAG TPA: hypothetical protein VF988_06485, partial [Verrucomicrobiae bacterium]
TPHYLRGLFQAMRSLAVQNLRLLRKQLKALPHYLVPLAQRAIEMESVILQQYRRLIIERFEAARIRIHGDFHLRQILWTGRDIVFLDLEGDATASISERRIKRSPLHDVAFMLRSLHHAAYGGFHKQVELGVVSWDNLPKFEPWVRHWNRAISRAYLAAYCEKIRPSGLLPAEDEKLRMMLTAYLLNQVMEELGCGLQAPSDNLLVTLRAILILTEEEPAAVAVPAATPDQTTNDPPTPPPQK